MRLALRAALLAAALGQLAVTVPLLIMGHDHDAGAHAAHELGSFDLALAIAFAVGAIRPALSAGLAWTCGIAAAGLAGTAIADLIGGQAIGADEAQHLIAVAGAAAADLAGQDQPAPASPTPARPTRPAGRTRRRVPARPSPSLAPSPGWTARRGFPATAPPASQRGPAGHRPA